MLRWLFPADSGKWLAILRVGLGLEVLLYALSLFPDWNYLFAATGQGLVTRNAAEGLVSLQSALIPRLGWFVELGAHAGLPEPMVLLATWLGLVCAGAGLIVGFASRSSAILAWFLHLCAAKSGEFVSYGVDNFTTIGLFYLMLSPLPDSYSLDSRWRNLSPRKPHLLGFFRRALQLHLSFIYFFGGTAKCLGSGWWDGANIWRALTRPPFNVIPPEILVRWKWCFPIMGVAICLLEFGYPIFIWLKRTRFPWLVAVIGMHAAIGIGMGMYLFASIMIVLNTAAFGPGCFVPSVRKRAGEDAMIASST
jgi:hypothetical protein